MKAWKHKKPYELEGVIFRVFDWIRSTALAVFLWILLLVCIPIIILGLYDLLARLIGR